MTRRQKKKRFKRKWLNGHHAVFLRTVPNKWKASWADKINEIFEEEYTKRMEAAILYGTGQTVNSGQYIKPRVFQSVFCVSCENRDGDPIFAACSVCRTGQNGRPTQYRRETVNGENQLG